MTYFCYKFTGSVDRSRAKISITYLSIDPINQMYVILGQCDLIKYTYLPLVKLGHPDLSDLFKTNLWFHFWPK